LPARIRADNIDPFQIGRLTPGLDVKKLTGVSSIVVTSIVGRSFEFSSTGGYDAVMEMVATWSEDFEADCVAGAWLSGIPYASTISGVKMPHSWWQVHVTDEWAVDSATIINMTIAYSSMEITSSQDPQFGRMLNATAPLYHKQLEAAASQYFQPHLQFYVNWLLQESWTPPAATKTFLP